MRPVTMYLARVKILPQKRCEITLVSGGIVTQSPQNKYIILVGDGGNFMQQGGGGGYGSNWGEGWVKKVCE